jgi:hypothetical protein
MCLSATFFSSFVLDLPSLAATPATAADKKPKQDPILKGLPITELSADEAIEHALNRLAYGARPGDAEKIKQVGLAKWIDQQLNPKAIDDSAMQARLVEYPTLSMSTTRLIAEYPNPKQVAKQDAKATAANQSAAPGDAAAAVIRRDMQKGQSQPQQQTLDSQETAQKDADAGVTAMAQEMDNNPGSTQNAGGNPKVAAASLDTPSPMKLNPATRGGGKKDLLGMDPNAVPKVISDDSKRPQRVVEELAMAKMTRAIYSERQLQQVMDDFWFNHFNVFAGKGEVKWYLTSYERDVIQPNALGKFKDLLTATAKSPAMLFYLDNFLSADPDAAARLAAERAQRQPMRRGPNTYPPRPQQAQNKKKQDRGLNENYGLKWRAASQDGPSKSRARIRNSSLTRKCTTRIRRSCSVRRFTPVA